MKRSGWLVIKLLIAAGLLYWLFQGDSLSPESLSTLVHHPGPVAVLTVVFGINLLLGSLRWKWLLSALEIHVPYRKIVDINMIGIFGNIFLPGGAGGDAMRAYYITKTHTQSITKPLLTLAADRIMGLLGLMLLAISMATLHYTQLSDSSEARVFIELVLVLFSTAIVSAAVMLLLANRFQIRKRLKSIQRFSRLISILIHVLDAVVMFKSKFLLLLACIGLSMIMQLGIVYSLAALGQALFGEALTSLQYAAAGSFSMLANAIPLTPGGIGLGESAFNYFCQALSSDPSITGYATVFFSFRIIVMLLSLIGGWRFIVYRHQHSDPNADATSGSANQ